MRQATSAAMNATVSGEMSVTVLISRNNKTDENYLNIKKRLIASATTIYR